MDCRCSTSLLQQESFGKYNQLRIPKGRPVKEAVSERIGPDRANKGGISALLFLLAQEALWTSAGGINWG
jgi:hypothetical protein